MNVIATINGSGATALTEIDAGGALCVMGSFDGAAVRIRVSHDGLAWGYLAGPDGRPMRITEPMRLDVGLESGDYISVEVSGANATAPGGTSLTVGIEAGPIDKPASTTAPVVTMTDDGEAITLSCSRGWWSGKPTEWTFQWQTDDGEGYANIEGETGSTYTAAEGDLGNPIKCLVTAKNAIGTAAAAAASNAVTITAPAGVSASITGYDTAPEIGDVLTASCTTTDDGTPVGITSYQWYQIVEATPTDIDGATGATYTVQEGDEGLALGVTVTVANTVGDDSDTAETPAVAAAE